MAQNLLILLITYLFLSQVSSEDLCISQAIQTINNPTLPYTASISQTECAYFFAIPSSLAIQNNYLIIEIEFSASTYRPLFMPLVMADIVYPKADLDDGTITPKSRWVDASGFANRKLYQNIIISPSDINTIDTYYFGVYKGYTKEPLGNTFDYTVTIRTSPNFVCPKGCDGHGTCNLVTQKCECNRGYFDQDCSVEATEVVAGAFSRKTIEQSEWNYFYFNIKDVSSDLKILFQKDVGTVDVSFLASDEGILMVPNYIQTSGKYQLTSKQTQSRLMVTKDVLAQMQKDVVLVGVFNVDSPPMLIQASFEEYDSTSVIRIVSITVFGTITGLMLLSWILFSLLRLRSHRDMEALIQQHEGEKEQEKILSKKDIFKYFPKKKFQDIHSNFPQTMCSICIDDFTPESICRQLYCDHIFHVDCIGAWLNQHHDCPNCKKEMSKAAIEEFLRHRSENPEKSKEFAHSPLKQSVKTDLREQARHSVKIDVHDQPRHSTKTDGHDQAGQDGAKKPGLVISPLRVDVRRPPRESLLKVTLGREEIKHDDEFTSMRRKSGGMNTETQSDAYSQESISPDEIKKTRPRLESGNISPRAIPRGSLVQIELQDRVQSRLRRHSRHGVALPPGLHAEVEKSSFKPH